MATGGEYSPSRAVRSDTRVSPRVSHGADPTPSPDDLHLTAEALAAGRLLDIELLDHVVIGHASFVSLRDRGVSFDRPGAHGLRAAAG